MANPEETPNAVSADTPPHLFPHAGTNRQKQLHAALKSESLTAIYSSDLARAMETARPLSKMTGLPINGTSAFRERSVGVMEGLTFEDAAQQHPEQYAALLQARLRARVDGR